MATAPPARGSVAELTAALASGLHHRRFADLPRPLPKLPVPEPLEVTAQLLPVSGLLGHPAGAKPSPVRPLVRFVRRATKALLRPWLELQTIFNHRSIGVMDAVQSWAFANLTRVHRRCEELEEALVAQTAAHHALALRVGECFDELLRERARVRKLADELDAHRDRMDTPAVIDGTAGTAASPRQTPPGGLTERVIETVFAHTRLPAPPARVLDLGCPEPAGSLDLGSIGYQAAGVDLRGLPPRSKTSVPAPVPPPADLPCPDAAFDAVVAVGSLARLPGLGTANPVRLERHLGAEVYRVLRPGGRFIFSVPFARAAAVAAGVRIHDRSSLAQLLTHFRAVEQGYAVETGDGWIFSADPPTGDGTALALVVAEKN